MTHMYDLTMRSISGEEVSLSDFRDKVCLIVNVASY
ncbi:MAG: Glutathione peroxidase [Actinomycetota bacterium]|jgi:glutathione peroxidase-family protein